MNELLINVGALGRTMKKKKKEEEIQLMSCINDERSVRGKREVQIWFQLRPFILTGNFNPGVVG
jgi:hypothetical protein